jgi:hypothetical protein
MSKSRLFSPEKTIEIFHIIKSRATSFEFDKEKYRLSFSAVNSKDQLYLRLPINLKYPFESTAENELPLHYIILLIQAGNCALGYFENGKNLNHKVFRSYMVRKKQGKSQIKYLKTKGKSRAGSRVRLGETVEFFENINERLQQYFDEHQVHRIAISCSKTLMPYLYNSKIPTPFNKFDERIYKIPKHIHTPIYDVLLEANKFLLKGELIYEESQQDIIDQLLREAGISDSYDENDLESGYEEY